MILKMVNLNENTYYLEAKSVKGIESLYNSTELYENVKVSHNTDFSVQLEYTPYLFEINGLKNAFGITEIQIFQKNNPL